MSCLSVVNGVNHSDISVRYYNVSGFCCYRQEISLLLSVAFIVFLCFRDELFPVVVAQNHSVEINLNNNVITK